MIIAQHNHNNIAKNYQLSIQILLQNLNKYNKRNILVRLLIIKSMDMENVNIINNLYTRVDL
jgi:hypothetical protein